MARRLWLEPLESRQLLATILVTTEFDIVDLGDSFTSLREAVLQANNTTTHDTITFASSLANKPVLLLRPVGRSVDTVTIQGLGAALTTVNGQNTSRLFDITNAAGEVTFDGLTLTGGQTTLAEMRTAAPFARLPPSQLTIQNSTITGNSTIGNDSRGGGIDAGGIYAGPLTVTNSTISGNSTPGKQFSGRRHLRR